MTKLKATPPEVGSPEWHVERRRIGWQVASEGGNVSDFARRCGIRKQSAHQWLEKYAEDLRRTLVNDGRRSQVLPPEARLKRLTTYKAARDAGLSHSAASERCCLSQSRMRRWLAMWAPDGVDQAIEDETEASADAREDRRYG